MAGRNIGRCCWAPFRGGRGNQFTLRTQSAGLGTAAIGYAAVVFWIMDVNAREESTTIHRTVHWRLGWIQAAILLASAVGGSAWLR